MCKAHNINIMNRQITINITNTPLPAGINAALIEAGNDSFIICLNSKMTDDERTAGFLHECLHIYHDDINSNKSANKLEQTRHKELLRLLKTIEQETTQI